MTDPTPARFEGLPCRTGEAFDTFIRQPFDARAMELMQMPMRPSDVVVATFPKTGTTWTQQICHGLRSRGDMNFDEVSRVAPWIERGHMFGIDATAPQQFEPRVFKTHLEYEHVNKGARYIHVIRDPKDVLVSFYGFMSSAIIDPNAISIDTFANVWLLSDHVGERSDPNAPFGPFLYNYWRHLLDWWAAREHAPVLTLAYEHMRADLRGHVARIAAFMGITADRALLDLATRQSTFEYMALHKDQFADHIPDTPMRFHKVVNGQVGSHRLRVSAALGARIDAAWQHYVTPVLGFENYEALVKSLP
ncbi:MAG: sulfotransferase domain-containing protein [Proteobacteria bacterium]|nr:sulfotransferase domain-containing protein [Pseudomonadota bacterium]